MIYQPAEDSYLMSRVLKEQLPSLLAPKGVYPKGTRTSTRPQDFSKEKSTKGKENPDLRFLEIGSGSGIHLETAKKLGVKQKNIFSVDINHNAVLHCQSLGFNCIYSDLFENVSGKFDLIIFNPPYLPLDSKEDSESALATTGGESGSEVINRFLKEAKNYLNKDGKIFLITSSLTKGIDFLAFQKKEIGCEKLFFERLCVWELI